MTFTELLWRVVGALAIVGGSALVGGWLSVIASVAAIRRGVSTETARRIETWIPGLAVLLGSIFGIEFLFGLPMVSLGLTLGAGLLALSLASVPVIANVIGGLGIRLREQLVVGATLRARGHEGAIVDIGWLGVRLHRRYESEVFVPWLVLLVSPIEVRGDAEHRPIAVPLLLAADTDLEHAAEIIVAAAISVEGVLDDPGPELIVQEITGRGVGVVLDASVDSEHRYRAVRSAVVAAVARSLRESDVQVAA